MWAPIVAALGAAAAAGLAVRPRRPPARRLAAVASRPAGPDPPPPVGRRSRVVYAAAAAAGAIAVLGIARGGLVGGLAAAFVLRAARRPSPPSPDVRDLPLLVDLLAGCLTAGVGLPDALDAAAAGVDAGLGSQCRAIAAALRSGVPPDEAVAGWREQPALAPVARTLARTAATGAGAAADLRRTAARLRAQHRAAGRRRVQQASVWVVLPLGLCFLPAFVLVAVVPLVVGLIPALR